VFFPSPSTSLPTARVGDDPRQGLYPFFLSFELDDDVERPMTFFFLSRAARGIDVEDVGDLVSDLIFSRASRGKKFADCLFFFSCPAKR